MAGAKGLGKGKGKGRAPPPLPKGKGKCKGNPLTFDSTAPNHPRMTSLMSDGKIVQGITMSGEVVFALAAEEVVTAKMLTRQIQEALIHDAANIWVSLLFGGRPMQDDELVSDVNSIVVKWRRGWKKVICEERSESNKEIGGIALAVETERPAFEECRLRVLQQFCDQFERDSDSSPGLTEKPKIVAGFTLPKGSRATSWPQVHNYQECRGGEALPMETDIPDFQDLRQRLIDFKVLQATNYAPELYSDQQMSEIRQRFRVIPAARPKANLDIPAQKCVDISETVRTHLGYLQNQTQNDDIVEVSRRELQDILVSAFGFCVDADLTGNDLGELLQLLKRGDTESLVQHASVGRDFEAEALRLGVCLKDILPCVQVTALDAAGGCLYSLHPVQDVAPSQLTGKVPLTFTCGLNLPQQAVQAIPSITDLCKVAINPRSYNEHKRLALEALTLQSSSQDGQLSADAKKGLVTIGCLLAIHSDAAVREQAQELLIASISSDSLKFVRKFFNRRHHHLGMRIVEELSVAVADHEAMQLH